MPKLIENKQLYNEIKDKILYVRNTLDEHNIEHDIEDIFNGFDIYQNEYTQYDCHFNSNEYKDKTYKYIVIKYNFINDTYKEFLNKFFVKDIVNEILKFLEEKIYLVIIGSIKYYYDIYDEVSNENHKIMLWDYKFDIDRLLSKILVFNDIDYLIDWIDDNINDVEFELRNWLC